MIILLLASCLMMLVAALPGWFSSRNWGYAAGGGLGILAMILMGSIRHFI